MSDKKLRKHALTLFKLVQSYMGDRKSKLSPDQVFFLCFIFFKLSYFLDYS